MASAPGETLQAVGGHAFKNPLQDPGEIDLTAHVDFQAFAQAAESMGARVQGPIEQAQFLRALGIDKRAAALTAFVPPAKAEEINASVKRLMGEGSTGMGRLFKVLAIADPKIGPLPGFESPPP
jgi:SAM-dependent MidA family methyltransferase